jgi:glycopeptide antibiotics resistance protein
VAGAAFFVGVELLQLLEVMVFPGSPRTTDVNDVILNTAGVVLGILGYVLFADWFQSRDRRQDLGDSTWVEYLRSVTVRD